jgi:hypothetical protein
MRRALWVESEAIPSMDGYEKDQPRAAAVFEYDVDTGRLRREHIPHGRSAGLRRLDTRPRRHGFRHDGFTPRLWRIPPGGDLEIFRFRRLRRLAGKLPL